MSPAVAPPSGDWLPAKFRKIEADIKALATQQNFTFTDSGGHTRAQVGQLPDEDFGVAIYSPANDGTYAELLPPFSQYAAPAVTATSTSYAALAGSPSVTATLGAHGDAIISVSAFIQLSASNLTGLMGLSIDSGAPHRRSGTERSVIPGRNERQFHQAAV
jgi:hypothetical protein